jgi:hypothetical protein
MGVKKSMQTFFEAMEGNQLPKSGGRIIQTPMGPFTWDNLQESWVNINNGFKLPNMSLQELMMFGYDPSVDGGKDTRPVDTCVYLFGSTQTAILRSLTIGTPDTYTIASTNFTLDGTATCFPTFQWFITDAAGNPLTFSSLTDLTFEYSTTSSTPSITITDGSSFTLDSLTFSVGPSSRYRLRVTSGASPAYTEFNIFLKNTSVQTDEIIIQYNVRVPS